MGSGLRNLLFCFAVEAKCFRTNTAEEGASARREDTRPELSWVSTSSLENSASGWVWAEFARLRCKTGPQKQQPGDPEERFYESVTDS